MRSGPRPLRKARLESWARSSDVGQLIGMEGRRSSPRGTGMGHDVATDRLLGIGWRTRCVVNGGHDLVGYHDGNAKLLQTIKLKISERGT